MTATDVMFEPVGFDHPDAALLRGEQQAEIQALYGADLEPGAKPTAADIAHFVVGRAAGGEPIACGGFRRLTPDLVELKRMYVRPHARGIGLGLQLLTALEATARASGATSVILETGNLQAAAIALYLRRGYSEVPPPSGMESVENSRWFTRSLAAGTT